MQILTCLLALALGASAYPSPLTSCGPQNIVLKQVTDTWSLPVTQMAPLSTCTYTFEIPADTFAEVILSGTGLGYGDTIYAVGIQTPFGGPSNPATTYQLTTLAPSKFEVSFSAGQNSTMSVQFSVDLQKVNSAVAGSLTVNSNGDSKLIYLEQWQVGTSYQVTADNLVRLSVAFHGVNSGTFYQMNNIFIYDGENAPRTINGVESSYFLSKNKKVSLYLARKITVLEGALFLTDNSNVEGTINHNVQYVPTDPNYADSYATMDADWQYKPNSPWGAVTIIGKPQGTPFDVRALYTLSGNGTVLHAIGGPLPNHPNGKAFGQKNLPLHADGTMNTFYLTQGDANFKYTVN